MLDRGSVILYLILCDFGWVQETRNLKTGLMLTLALEDGCCHTFKGKRFPIKRFVYLSANTCCAQFSQLDSRAVVVFLSVLVTVVNCSGVVECWIYDWHSFTCASATATFWIALTSGNCLVSWLKHCLHCFYTVGCLNKNQVCISSPKHDLAKVYCLIISYNFRAQLRSSQLTQVLLIVQLTCQQRLISTRNQLPLCFTRSPAIAEGPRDAGVPVEIW